MPQLHREVSRKQRRANLEEVYKVYEILDGVRDLTMVLQLKDLDYRFMKQYRILKSAITAKMIELDEFKIIDPIKADLHDFKEVCSKLFWAPQDVVQKEKKYDSSIMNFNPKRLTGLMNKCCDLRNDLYNKVEDIDKLWRDAPTPCIQAGAMTQDVGFQSVRMFTNHMNNSMRIYNEAADKAYNLRKKDNLQFT